MDTEDLVQQQALQKEFNELVLSLSQQVSQKYLLDANKNIKKINSDIVDNLEKHALLLTEVGKKHPKSLEDIGKKYLSDIDSSLNNVNTAIAKQLAVHAALLSETSNTHAKKLEQVSKNHLVEINNNLKNLNEDIPLTLNNQSLALQSIEKLLHQHYSDIRNAIKNESNNLIAINERLLAGEVEKLKQKIETSFKISNSEMSELKLKNHKISNELNSALEAKTKSVVRTILYVAIAIVICLGLPMTFLIYSIVVR